MLKNVENQPYLGFVGFKGYIDLSNIYTFLLASEIEFQSTKDCIIYILYAKVIKDQSLIGRSFKIVSLTKVNID